jgi:CRP/FNR family transcriptional regulator, cyclic AMP receptor protein
MPTDAVAESLTLVEQLRGAMAPVTLRAGRTLFEQGDEATSLFVVEEGHLKIGRRTPVGRQRILALTGPGDMIGEMSLLDGSSRDGTATAVTDCVLLELSQADFDAYLAARPAVVAALFSLIGRRLRESNEVVSEMIFADVPTRVATSSA